MRPEASAGYGRLNEALEFLSFVGRSEHGSGSALKNVSDTSINGGQTDYKWYGEAGTEDFLANNPPAPVVEREVAEHHVWRGVVLKDSTNVLAAASELHVYSAGLELDS